METNSLLLVLLIIFSIIFLSLLALNIDLLSRFRFTKANWNVYQSFTRAQIEDISHYLNSRVLTDVQIEEVITKCPVDAINKVDYPEIHLTISETKCLGLSCSVCMKIILQSLKKRIDVKKTE